MTVPDDLDRYAKARAAREPAFKEKRRDPESEFYDSVKKKSVIVELQSGMTVEGTLAWVSTYSIGVTQKFITVRSGAGAVPDLPTTSVVVLIMKGSIATLREAV